MKMSRMGCVLGLCASVVMGTCAAGPFLQSETAKMMGLDKARSVTWLDAKGKPISEDDFVAQKKSFSISKKKNEDGTLDVVVRLNDPAAAPKPAVAAVALKVGDALPRFALPALDGKTVSSDSLRGRYAVLSFYFAECGPCVREVPQLNALAQAKPELAYLALTFDSAAEARQFVKERKLAWPVVAEAKAYFDTLKVKSYPLLMLIGPDGKVAALRAGLSDGMPEVGAWVEAQMRTAARGQAHSAAGPSAGAL